MGDALVKEVQEVTIKPGDVMEIDGVDGFVILGVSERRDGVISIGAAKKFHSTITIRVRPSYEAR